jgi:hypothetical protein
MARINMKIRLLPIMVALVALVTSWAGNPACAGEAKAWGLRRCGPFHRRGVRRHRSGQHHIRTALCFGALYLCLALFASGQGATPQLKSIDELKEKFMMGKLSGEFKGKRYFLGSPKPIPRYKRGKWEIYRVDSAALAVEPLMSDAQYEKAFNGYGPVDFATSPLGDNLFVFRGKNYRDGGYIQDLVRIDPATGDGEVLVADGTYNYNYTISPSGRYVAFYSSDHRVVSDCSSLPFVNACKILDLATKTVKTCIQPARFNQEWPMYIPPAWLDNERVVMNGVVTNPELLKQQPNRPSKEQACCYVAVVNAASGQAKKFFMPLGFRYVAFHVLGNSLILSNERQVIRTDWNLVPQEVITTVRENQVLAVRIEDGKVKHSVRDRQIFNPPPAKK